jgi:hypothetical protein
LARFEIDENVARLARERAPQKEMGLLGSIIVGPLIVLLVFMAYFIPVKVILFLL